MCLWCHGHVLLHMQGSFADEEKVLKPKRVKKLMEHER